jgi:hypothetical protein
MSDRLYVYKTPLQRIFEPVLVLALAFAAAALQQALMPETPISYVILLTGAVGLAIVPRLGERCARYFGAGLMTRDERDRRYLSEIGPIGLTARYAMARPAARRRGGSRSIRRA